jgi:hypothetical protein
MSSSQARYWQSSVEASLDQLSLVVTASMTAHEFLQSSHRASVDFFVSAHYCRSMWYFARHPRPGQGSGHTRATVVLTGTGSARQPAVTARAFLVSRRVVWPSLSTLEHCQPVDVVESAGRCPRCLFFDRGMSSNRVGLRADRGLIQGHDATQLFHKLRCVPVLGAEKSHERSCGLWTVDCGHACHHSPGPTTPGLAVIIPPA